MAVLAGDVSWELLSYFLIYSFLGWLVEVGVMAVRERRFCNRGFFNLPVCLSYGVIFDLLYLTLPTLPESYVLQFLLTLAVTSVAEYFAGLSAKKIWGRTMWRYEAHNLFGGEARGIFYTGAVAACVLLVYHLVHPVILLAVHMLPAWLSKTGSLAAVGLLALDYLTIFYVAHTSKSRVEVEAFQRDSQQGKRKMGRWLHQAIWKRINRAYPDMDQEESQKASGYVFAEGLCFDKFVWVFLICAFLGDIVETFYCRLTAGVWMSRSSVIYGAFSLVWGIGAALLTVMLQRLSQKEDRYIFLSGCLLGGGYEYMCSVFTEVFLGTVFWDYSHLPFNIGGRTNLLFCIFWGLLAVVWVKVFYPQLSRWIERIPPLTGKILTWLLLLFMVCNALISAMAMSRYTCRRKGASPENAVEEFIDRQYPDSLVERIWPNMKIKK